MCDREVRLDAQCLGEVRLSTGIIPGLHALETRIIER
jgi:hypothetical protein